MDKYDAINDYLKFIANKSSKKKWSIEKLKELLVQYKEDCRIKERRCTCDVCKYSSPHDYVENHYYCDKKVFFNDKEPRSCSIGVIDEWKWNFKYKQYT